MRVKLVTGIKCFLCLEHSKHSVNVSGHQVAIIPTDPKIHRLANKHQFPASSLPLNDFYLLLLFLQENKTLFLNNKSLQTTVSLGNPLHVTTYIHLFPEIQGIFQSNILFFCLG